MSRVNGNVVGEMAARVCFALVVLAIVYLVIVEFYEISY